MLVSGVQRGGRWSYALHSSPGISSAHLTYMLYGLYTPPWAWPGTAILCFLIPSPSSTQPQALPSGNLQSVLCQFLMMSEKVSWLTNNSDIKNGQLKVTHNLNNIDPFFGHETNFHHKMVNLIAYLIFYN